MRHRWLGLAACILAAGSISGCGVDAFNRGKTPAPAEPERGTQDVSAIAPLLEMMSSLPKVDPARQAEMFQSAKDAADLTPTTSNRLRYALALATPGYSGSDPVAAQRQLSELLARPETLLPVESLLALVELKEVEQRLVLQAENKRMHDDASHDETRDKLAAINRRLAAESDENVRLRKALDEARAKLDAVTHIERSINDRGTSGSHTP
jgi:site-specific recombinase